LPKAVGARRMSVEAPRARRGGGEKTDEKRKKGRKFKTILRTFGGGKKRNVISGLVGGERLISG